MKDKLYDVLGDLNELTAKLEHLYYLMNVLEQHYEEKENEDVLSIVNVSKIYVGMLRMELGSITRAIDEMMLTVKKI